MPDLAPEALRSVLFDILDRQGFDSEGDFDPHDFVRALLHKSSTARGNEARWELRTWIDRLTLEQAETVLSRIPLTRNEEDAVNSALESTTSLELRDGVIRTLESRAVLPPSSPVRRKPVGKPAPARPTVPEEGDQASPVRRSGKARPVTGGGLPRVFISHASADKPLVNAFKEMLVLGGVPQDRIFYTGHPATGVPFGTPLRAYIQEQLVDAGLVVQLISPAFLASHFCVLELGGQWALETSSFPIAVPPLTPKEIGDTLGGALVARISERPDLLNLADRIGQDVGLRLPTSTWAEAVDRFLSRLPALGPAQPVERSTPGGAASASRRGRQTLSELAPRMSPRDFLISPPVTSEPPVEDWLVIRAATSHPASEPVSSIPRGYRSIERHLPTEALRGWRDFYLSRGTAGEVREPRLSSVTSRQAIAIQEVDSGSGQRVNAVARVGVLLPDSVSPEIRYLAEVWLSPRGPLPLDKVLATLRDLAEAVTTQMPAWFAELAPEHETGAIEHVELHLSPARDSQAPRDMPLGALLDLSIFGPPLRGDGAPRELRGAEQIRGAGAAEINEALRRAVGRFILDGGYTHAPDDLADKLVAYQPGDLRRG